MTSVNEAPSLGGESEHQPWQLGQQAFHFPYPLGHRCSQVGKPQTIFVIAAAAGGRPLETLALVWGAEFDGAAPSRATKLPTGGPARPGASKLHSSSNSSGGSTTSSSGSENESMPAAAATGHAGLVRHRSKPPSGALQAFAAKSNGNGSSSASGIGSSGTGSFIDSNMCRGSTDCRESRQQHVSSGGAGSLAEQLLPFEGMLDMEGDGWSWQVGLWGEGQGGGQGRAPGA